MRTKLGIIILIIFIVSLTTVIIIDNLTPIHVSAYTLAQDYSNNADIANRKYLNRNVEVTGSVKAFYKIMNTRNVLELNTKVSSQNLFCFFTSQPTETKAGSLIQGQNITVEGKCLGNESYNFVKGIKIDVDKIIFK